MSEPRFIVDQGDPLAGRLVYSDMEHSFRFEVASPADLEDRSGELGRTSVAIGTLQVELDIASGRSLFVWGLHPRRRWDTSSAFPQRIRAGVVRLAGGTELVRGVTVSIAEVGDWLTTYDEESGWVRVGARAHVDDDEQVLIATDTVLGLRAGLLSSIWLRPDLEDVIASGALERDYDG